MERPLLLRERSPHQMCIRDRNGCDVVTEKPMTIDAEKVGAVLSAVEQTGRRLTVTRCV